MVAKVEEVIPQENQRIGEVMWEELSSIRSKFKANGEDCLDGYDGADGREVKGDRVDLGVVNSFLGEITRDVMSERGGDIIVVDKGAVW
ncbi:hypothetical protein Tco_0895275 [Tanacetum coccineum]|uniref:Uncharacterized protein n=1 Tax=Tanacetum coccineum TaxID=301880 RepID=A0ABQ5CGQ6_9ASTR